MIFHCHCDNYYSISLNSVIIFEENLYKVEKIIFHYNNKLIIKGILLSNKVINFFENIDNVVEECKNIKFYQQNNDIIENIFIDKDINNNKKKFFKIKFSNPLFSEIFKFKI
jgi:hypothetical protein